MRIAVLIIAIVVAVPFLAVIAAAGRGLQLVARLREAAETNERHSILVGSLARTYLLHVPVNLPTGKPVPLVLVFHGGGGHDWTMPGFTHFDELADREGFVVAYPDGANRNWNDTRGESTADDVGFTRALIDEISRSNSIDPRRVYATGISNGGFFSNRLACELTDKIAAIASVAAPMPKLLAGSCKPSRPISILYMQGTDDPIVPINGGTIGLRHGRARGENISLDESVSFWRQHDRITSAPVARNLPDIVGDGTHVRREIWSGGADGTEIVVYTIGGGGHAWPGGVQYLPKIIVGKASQNLNATQAIWDFFRTKIL